MSKAFNKIMKDLKPTHKGTLLRGTRTHKGPKDYDRKAVKQDLRKKIRGEE